MTPLKNRVQGPRTKEEFDREARMISRGSRIPGDDLDDILNVIREGDSIEEIDGESASIPALTPIVSEKPITLAPQGHHTPPAQDIPVEILDVLNSAERNELMEVARQLRRSQEHERTLLFITPVGNIKCTVNWMSCQPKDISTSSMFFVKTRVNALAFIPKPGAVFDISFEGYPTQTKVMCLAEPQRLYPGVDLLCFMPHTPAMEKTGKLSDQAPSVVSGKPATTVVENEPVVEGEQPMHKAAFTLGNPQTGYDNPRPL
jgi:hypothetical protein